MEEEEKRVLLHKGIIGSTPLSYRLFSVHKITNKDGSVTIQFCNEIEYDNPKYHDMNQVFEITTTDVEGLKSIMTILSSAYLKFLEGK